jgi:hypothetical protein
MDSPILLSGYAVGSNGQPQGETLLMRTLPLISNPLREPLWGSSINFKDVRNPIIDVLISSTFERSQVHTHVAPTLHECVLAFCVKTIKSSYSLGTYYEEVLHTYSDHTTGGWPWSAFSYDDGSTDQTYLEDVTIRALMPGPDFPASGWGLPNSTMVMTTLIFNRMFPAFTTVANDSTQGTLRWRLDHPTKVRTTRLMMNPWLLPNNVTKHLESLATAMTNVIRSDPSSRENIIGDVFIAETYLVVHWAWLAFPLIMLGLSIVFLGATIIKTSRSTRDAIGVWKTSAMAVLLYSLPKDVRHDVPSSSTWHRTPKDDSKHVRIRLVPDQGWRVSGRVAVPQVLHRHSGSRP